jgi:hypothetical protein
MKAVIDTNVLLVANEQHSYVSIDCIEQCVRRLQEFERSGIVVVDDGYRILGEYQNKTNLKPPKGVGDVFLKHLLRNLRNPKRVEQVEVIELSDGAFAEFPAVEINNSFDAADRKFVAVSNAHPEKPPILQAADSKWLDWWQALETHGIRVEFLCPSDAKTFYEKKFSHKPTPNFPI